VGSSAFQHQVFFIDFIEQQPIGRDMTITVARPIARQRMIAILGQKMTVFR
jgi:hypothetical protein